MPMSLKISRRFIITSFFQLKGGDAESQQTADFRMTVKHYRLYAVTRQHVSASQPCRTGADNRHPLAGRNNVGDARFPAHFDGFIVNIAFNIADRDRAELVVQRSGALAQPVLRADPPAHFRQTVSLMREFRRFNNPPLVGKLQPVGNYSYGPDISIHSKGCRRRDSGSPALWTASRRTARRFP